MPLKNDILEALESSRGLRISGQELSKRFNVSRNAVWKAINNLKNEGHNISSSTKLGYFLESESDVLSCEAIRVALPESRKDIEIVVLPETRSTNNHAKSLISEGISGYTLVVAETQTAGKGRLGRSFFSPKGSIYMSLAFKIDSEIADAIKLTTAAAVAVVKAAETHTDARPLIKWVNDVYLDGRKICGILTEGVTDLETSRVSHIVIGIGINCGKEEFPEEIRDVATSLDLGKVPRSRMIASVAAELMDFIEGKTNFLEYYREKSLVLGKEINYFKNGVATVATAIAIDDNGGLVVRHADGSELCLNTGEISVRLR